MSHTFRPAVRANVQLLLSIAGPTGSGKTYSSLLLASGMAGGRRFAGIDTENGRMLHYADSFEFDHAEIRAPFRPGAYAEKIKEADAAGYPVILVDSASHEHAGDGGLLDYHAEIVAETVERKRKLAAKNDWRFDEWKEEQAANFSAWIKPKAEHKHFVETLLRVKAHVILCFRAEQKISIEKDEKGKTVIKEKESPVGAHGFIPIAEKTLPYEMTASFLMTADRPGFPIPIKLQEQHRSLVSLDRPITKATGEALARWAAGAQPAPPLASILTAIKIAENVAQLDAVKPQAALLTGDDRAKAGAAFKAKQKELT